MPRQQDEAEDRRLDERLFDRQLASATAADGSLDVAMLRRLVVDCYRDATQDRRRSDRAIALMAEELEGANQRLRLLVEDLRVQNLRFEAALDSMSQGLCLYDHDDVLVVVNQRYHAIMGLEPGTFVPGMTYRAVIEAQAAAGLHPCRDVEELVAERLGLFGVDAELRRIDELPDDRRRITGTYRPRPTGGWVVTVEDVTAEREADARAAAAARLTSVGEMAAGLAHELKQPLTAIALAASNAERAADRGDLASLKVRLGRIIAQASRGGALIEHLRRFARGWDSTVAMGSVPVADAIAGVLTLVGGTLREASVEVPVTIEADLPLVRGDQMAIEQVLLNLLMNARDALAGCPGDGSGSGGRVSIRAMAAGPGVMIEVADNAGGIPEAVMRKLFVPFVTTKGPDRGTGLGLSICHGLVKAMGGTIDAENGPEGAVFRLHLSAAPCDSAQAA